MKTLVLNEGSSELLGGSFLFQYVIHAILKVLTQKNVTFVAHLLCSTYNVFNFDLISNALKAEFYIEDLLLG